MRRKYGWMEFSILYLAGSVCNNIDRSRVIENSTTDPTSHTSEPEYEISPASVSMFALIRCRIGSDFFLPFQ